MKQPVFHGGLIYGDADLARQIAAGLGKPRFNLHEEIRWELARRGGLTFRQLCGILGGISINRISASLTVMHKRGKLVRRGSRRNYLWMVPA